MSPELKKKWIAALRSGKFEQGVGGFLVDWKYCCLGVLCEAAGAPLIAHTEEPDEGCEGYTYFAPERLEVELDGASGATTFQPAALKELGMSNDVQYLLYNMNDGTGAASKQYSFLEIADWIEKHEMESGEEIP